MHTDRRRDAATASTPSTPTSPTTRLGSGRLAPLDGIRAIAALAVVAFHLGIGAAGGGFVGVDWFFVLSAFLVGTLLLDQLDRTGDIDLGRFYRRRAGRLVPALVVMVGVMLVAVAALVPSLLGDASKEALAAVTYLSNLTTFGVPELTSFFEHTWTLSLEMQFYLALPFVLRWVRRHGWRDGGVAAWAAAAAVVVAGLHCALLAAWPGHWLVERMPLFDTSRFAMGLALAFALRDGALVRLGAVLAHGWLAMVCGLLMLADLDLARFVSATWVPMHSLAIGVLVAIVLGHVVTQPEAVLARLLSLRPLVTVGLMSYSLYLWHFPILTLLEEGVLIDGHTGLRFALKVVATTVATWVSWRFVESWSSRRSARGRTVSSDMHTVSPA
ncbi:MAG: acyltransferase [Acidimicrobiales bacterium]